MSFRNYNPDNRYYFLKRGVSILYASCGMRSLEVDDGIFMVWLFGGMGWGGVGWGGLVDDDHILKPLCFSPVLSCLLMYHGHAYEADRISQFSTFFLGLLQ